MLDSFIFTVEAVIPVFLLVLTGYLLKCGHVIDEAFVSSCNKFTFNVALPVLLFKNVGECGFREAFNPKTMLFAGVSICVIFFLLMFLVPRIVKDYKKSGAIVQGMFRNNFVLLGLPLVINIAGEGGGNSAAALVIIAVIFNNLLATVCLEYFSTLQKQAGPSGGEAAAKKDHAALLGSMMLSVLKNPLIIASALGVLYSLSGWEMPTLIRKPLYDIAKIATPLALLTIGGQFNFRSVKKNRACVAVTTLVKLAVTPMIFVPLAVLLGFRGADLAGLFVFFAAPTAVSSYIMAQDMNSDGELAGQIVVFTTLFSALTIFLGVFILRSFHLVG